MQTIGRTRVLVLLLHLTLTCLYQTKVTIFRLVQIRLSSNFWPVGLSKPVTFTSLKIVVLFWDTQIRLGQRSIPGALFVPMAFILSTLFYYLQKREQAYRPRRRGLVGPLSSTIQNVINMKDYRSIDFPILEFNSLNVKYLSIHHA